MPENTASLFVLIVGVVISVLCGIVVFFLKRLMSQLDAKASKAAVDDIYKKMDELRTDLHRVETDYITKVDFFRQNASIQQQLDRVLKLLLDIHTSK